MGRRGPRPLNAKSPQENGQTLTGANKMRLSSCYAPSIFGPATPSAPMPPLELAPMTSTPPETPKSPKGPTPAPKKRRYRKAIGPRLSKVLAVVFGLVALLTINSTYLIGVSALESLTGRTYQNWFYMNMFFVHLILGLLLLLPVLIFGFVHMFNTYDRRNRRAVKVGYGLFAVTLLLIISGVILTRLEGIIVVKDEAVRSVAYWIHVITPLVAVWLFVLHRLAGKRIKWEVGRRWAVVAAAFAAVLLLWQAQDPRQWDVEGPESGEQYFFPSLARTATGDFIPEAVLANDAYCAECHEDTHRTWAASVHRFSSFNNEPYLFSVEETRRFSEELYGPGDFSAARFCAGCHDPVVFFSGKFDQDFDPRTLPAGQEGITCTSCHAITNVNSPRGNADYTIEEPVHYPFATSQNKTLQWVNRQLVKAKPEFHKKTFLKPLHQTPEFCGTCHKVHLPKELNNYKWLRGQNHYDSFFLSGVSGQGVTSFYYPKVAETGCNDCHMPTQESEQFAAKDLDGDGLRKIHDHQFPSANTAIPHLVGLEPWVNERHREFSEDVMRLDIFAAREGGTLDDPPVAPLDVVAPTLEPGTDYLLDVVIRTWKMGHHFTQGTTDSNQVWLDIRVTEERPEAPRVIGRSGGMDVQNRVDPWSHFVNSYVLDREGRRIDRRNPQDIFVALYTHQIPPGAADTVHYKVRVPDDARGPLRVEARLLFRKFDSTYMRQVLDDPEWQNDLPIMVLAEDTVRLGVRGGPQVAATAAEGDAKQGRPYWQRWNDYGIGLLRKGGKSKGELRQAEQAFTKVEELGRPEGPVNLARVYVAQGTVQDRAIAALERAASFDPPAPRWSVAWFTGLVNKQNGYLDEAIDNFTGIIELDDQETRERGFDFSKDYRLLVELGQTLFERSRLERGESRAEARRSYLLRARELFDRALVLDPENVSAHYNRYLLEKELGDLELADYHFGEYQRYKVDDNARDQAVAAARAADPAADHAAEAIVIYDLQRPESYEA